MNEISNNPSESDINMGDQCQDIPIECLGTKTLQKLSVYLNPTKILMTDDGYHRDWRGVLHFTGLSHYMSYLSKSSDQFGEMLKLWIEDKKESATVALLQKILGIIDRWDVLDDTTELFDNDVSEYLYHKARGIDLISTQQYDTFVAFAKEDIDFAIEMTRKIEEFNLSVCVKEQYLQDEFNLEHDAIWNLLVNRCSHIIVILSPAFINSSANESIAKLFQSLSVPQRSRKMIPCLYQPCDYPEVFQQMHFLDYKRSQVFNNFWKKLYDSLVNSFPLNDSSIMMGEVDLNDESYQGLDTSVNLNRLLMLDTLETSQSLPSSQNFIKKIFKRNKSRRVLQTCTITNGSNSNLRTSGFKKKTKMVQNIIDTKKKN